MYNWEIKVFTNAIPHLSQYVLENMIEKLKFLSETKCPNGLI